MRARLVSTRIALVVYASITILFSGLIVRWCGSVAGGADSSGYLNSARLILEGRIADEARPLARTSHQLSAAAGDEPHPAASSRFGALDDPPLTTWERTPLGFWPAQQDGFIVPIYPVGFPLHLAAASVFTGLEYAAILVNVAAWLATALLLWVLARECGLRPWWRTAAFVLFAVYPMTVLYFKRVMSDGLATAWSTATVLLAIKAEQKPKVAAWVGLSLGITYLVRPTSLLLIPAVVLALRFRWRSLVAVALGGMPVVIAISIYNRLLYGKILTTGYNSIGRQFSVENVWPCFLHFSEWLGRLLSPGFLVFLVAGLVFAVMGDKRQRILVSWSLAIFVFYLFYAPSLQGWWRLRFLLPAMPAMLISVALIGQSLYDRWQGWARWSVCLVLFGLFGWSSYHALSYDFSRKFWTKGRGSGEYQEAIKWLEAEVEPDAVILCKQASGAMLFYGDRTIVRYDRLVEKNERRLLEAASRDEIHLYALLFTVDVKPFENRYGSDWIEIGRRGQARLRRPP